jgi:hypothetical protein
MALPSMPKRSPGRRGWCVRSYVLDRRKFNELQMRLPRAVRRDVEPAPEGFVGLVAQAIVGSEDVPLAVLYGSVPASMAADGARTLERELAERLG